MRTSSLSDTVFLNFIMTSLPVWRTTVKLDAWEQSVVDQYDLGCKCGGQFEVHPARIVWDENNKDYVVKKVETSTHKAAFCNKCGISTAIDTNIVCVMMDL